MFQIIMKLIGVLIILSGVIMVYDARILTQNYFNFGDENNTTSGLKILGMIFVLIGVTVLYFNI